MEHDYPSGITNSFDALVAFQDPAAGGDAAEAVVMAGGRILASVGWGEVATRLRDIARRPILLLDTHGVDEAVLEAALPAIDGIAAGRDIPIVIGIAEAQIDTVAAGLALSTHEILCEPQPADWLSALALTDLSGRLTLHDHGRADSESARLAKLNAEVARITSVLARLSKREEQTQAAHVADRSLGFLIEPAEPPQVTAAAIRQIVRARRLRDRHLGDGLFEDPAWDMILDLYAAHLERAQVSVSSLCIAAHVAPTTALRWIARLSDAGIFERRPDPFDRRRAFMSLSDAGLAGMHRYVATVRGAGLPLV